MHFFSCHERCSYFKHRLEYPQSQQLSLHTRTFPQILSFTSCSSRNNAKGSRFYQSNVLEFSLIHTKLALISLKLRHRLHLVSQETVPPSYSRKCIPSGTLMPSCAQTMPATRSHLFIFIYKLSCEMQPCIWPCGSPMRASPRKEQLSKRVFV